MIDNELPINSLEDISAKNGYFVVLRKSSITNDYFEEAEYDTNPVAYQIYHDQFHRKGGLF